MHRIKALNRDEDADSSIFIDTVEKTIEVISVKLLFACQSTNQFLCSLQELKEAYMRALQAKRNGQCDSAVEMFEEILNCEEIKQVRWNNGPLIRISHKNLCYSCKANRSWNTFATKTSLNCLYQSHLASPSSTLFRRDNWMTRISIS